MLTRAQRDAVLADLIAAGNAFDPAAVFVGPAESVDDQDGIDTDLADVTLNTGTLATRLAVTTWSAPAEMPDGSVYVQSPDLLFSPAGGDTAQQVGAVIWGNLATLGNLLAWENLPAPLLLPDSTWTLTILARLRVDPNGNWNVSIAVL